MTSSLPLSLEEQKVRGPALSLTSWVECHAFLSSDDSRVIKDVPVLVLSSRNTAVVAATRSSRVLDDSREAVCRVGLVCTRPICVQIEGGRERDWVLVFSPHGVESHHLKDDDVGGVRDQTRTSVVGRLLAFVAFVPFD